MFRYLIYGSGRVVVGGVYATGMGQGMVIAMRSFPGCVAISYGVEI